MQLVIAQSHGRSKSLNRICRKMWAGQKIGRDLHCTLTNRLKSLHSTGKNRRHQGKTRKAGSNYFKTLSKVTS